MTANKTTKKRFPMRSSKYSPQPQRKLNQTNRLITAAVTTLGALALSATSALAFTNFLANPGFETGAVAPWVQYNDVKGSYYSIDSTNGFVYGSDTIHEPAHSDPYALKEWGTWWGSFVQTHTISQYVPAAANSTWSADIWAFTATPDNLQNNNYAHLQVSFHDASTNLLSEIFYSSVIDTNAPVNTWIHLAATNSLDGTTNLTAPDGTAFVRFGLFFSQDALQSGGSVYWDDANLIKTAASDPEISSSPQNQTVIYGQTTAISVLASGRTPLSYRWQKDGVDVSNGGRISGATTATLTIASATTADQGNYSVIVTDTAGSLPSPSSGYLTVLDPGILTNPVSLVKAEGQSAIFTVEAVGSGTLTYAWCKGATPLSNGGRISGADSTTLTIANLTVADSDDYSVIVTGAGQANSAVASLYVKTVPEASNLIRNGGFESELTYWTTWNGRTAVTAPPGAGETNYNGSQICSIYGTGNGTWNGVNQSFAVTPGAVYKASAWFLMSAENPIIGASEAWLEVNFYVNRNLITSFPSPYITSNSVAGVWTNLVVPYAVAPAGADEARCQINYHAMDGGGAIYLDDVSFWLKIPVTITPSLSGSNLLLSFPTQIGVSYQVLYKDDLSDATWQVLTTLTGDLSGQADVSTPRGSTKRFYWVNTL
jgi:hypothetical protein